MIPIKEIRELPELDWSDQALIEIGNAGADVLAKSQLILQLGNVCIAGLIYGSFTSPPWFWFALARNVGIRDLIDFRGASQRIPWGARTAIREDYEAAHRFARFYHFVPINEIVEYLGVPYVLYRKEG